MDRCHFKQLHRMFYGTFLQQWDRHFVSGCGNNGWRMRISKLFTVDGSARVKAILTNCMDLQLVGVAGHIQAKDIEIVILCYKVDLW